MLICGDSYTILSSLPDNYYNVVITSPPYFNLRRYSKSELSKNYEIGDESKHDCLGWATDNWCGECYICNIVNVCKEIYRVLHQRGSFWINIGDSYSGSGKGINSFGLKGDKRVEENV